MVVQPLSFCTHLLEESNFLNILFDGYQNGVTEFLIVNKGVVFSLYTSVSYLQSCKAQRELIILPLAYCLFHTSVNLLALDIYPFLLGAKLFVLTRTKH